MEPASAGIVTLPNTVEHTQCRNPIHALSVEPASATAVTFLYIAENTQGRNHIPALSVETASGVAVTLTNTAEHTQWRNHIPEWFEWNFHDDFGLSKGTFYFISRSVFSVTRQMYCIF